MPALAELEQAWQAGARGPGLPRGAGRAAARLRRAADAAVPRAPALRARRPAGLPQARGPQPHRLAQAQQRARPGAAGAGGWASGGSSPRPAPASTASRPPPCARCWGWSASSTWASRTRAASDRTCSAWSCSARACEPVDAGARTLKEATSAAIRDWVTNVAEHPLRDRLGRRPGALSGARARPAARDRRRGARADARARGPAAGARDRVRRRRLERDRHLRGVHPRRAGRSWWASRPAARASTPPPRRAADRRRAARDPARLALGGDAGRGGPDRRGALGLGRARLPGRRTAARLPARQRSRALRGGDRRARRCAAFREVARLEGIIPALETAHALAWVLAAARRRARPRVPVRSRGQGPGRGAREPAAEA